MSEFKIKAGLAQMLKNGVIGDVVTAEQADIMERSGAASVMALESIPSEMRKSNKVCRMSDPKMIKEIMEKVKIPVMAKVRIGHTVEAQILEALGVDYIDESEVLTPADNVEHIDKNKFKVPFVCGARNLGEALRRINEGAAMIRCKGEAGTGDVASAVDHIKTIRKEIEAASKLTTKEEKLNLAKELRVPVELVEEVIELKRLPVVTFAAGGVATPADAALLMQLGCDGVFVGSGIFNSKNPEKLARAIVNAVTHYNDPVKLLEYSTDLGDLMAGTPINSIKESEKLENRGW
ncbi:SNZ1 [Candida pseudojiufengensis]|uniref:SNZ1 n=1 Tax=Candida pseudojiufengensis TaxID=497109 RepID=UPI0022259162|nr:SNZ1 [Candida pseudojiufengensis]KAI5960305.1 SNZ1 [Candida pseudojiufengensis]